VRDDNLEEMADIDVLAHVDDCGDNWSPGRWATMNCETIGRQATSRGLADALGAGGRAQVKVGECGWCRKHAGIAVIGEDALPPYHPGCTCVAVAA
jgi:hypothetical protein